MCFLSLAGAVLSKVQIIVYIMLIKVSLPRFTFKSSNTKEKEVLPKHYMTEFFVCKKLFKVLSTYIILISNTADSVFKTLQITPNSIFSGSLQVINLKHCRLLRP